MREIWLSWFKQSYFILISFNVIYSKANISKDFCYEAVELSWIKRKEDGHGKWLYEVIWRYILQSFVLISMQNCTNNQRNTIAELLNKI